MKILPTQSLRDPFRLAQAGETALGESELAAARLA